MDNDVEIPVNAPLEIYLAAGHYPDGVKATVRMWYYNPYGRKEEIFDTTEVNSDSVKILTVPAFMRNFGKFPGYVTNMLFLFVGNV